MICNYFNEIMIYSSKYEAILKILLLYLVYRVDVEECYLYLILLGSARTFVFLVGEGLFFPIDETRCS